MFQKLDAKILRNNYRISQREKGVVLNKIIPDNINDPNEGYVNVRVKIDVDSSGNEKNISFISVSRGDSHSICLFVAGGNEIDKKVEEANARIIEKKIK